MNADASQAQLPLGVFLAISLPALLICALVWLFSDGGQRIDEATAELGTDEPPEVCAEAPELCTDPECACERARDIARQRLHAWFADRARIEWTADTDRELAELLDGGR